jgi:hypothetical protein
MIQDFEKYKEKNYSDLAVEFLESCDGSQSGESKVVSEAFETFCDDKYMRWCECAEDDAATDAADARREEEKCENN